MVGNESTDVVGGKDFFDSCCLFTWCQATDHHHKPPNSLNALVMRPSNPPRNVALFKNLRMFQQHHSSAKPPGGRSKSKAEHSRRSEGTEAAARVRQPLRRNDAERKFI